MPKRTGSKAQSFFSRALSLFFRHMRSARTLTSLTRTLASCPGPTMASLARTGPGSCRVKPPVGLGWLSLPRAALPRQASSSVRAEEPSHTPPPPPLTVTHVPESTSLAAAFAACGFSSLKTLKLGADHALSTHATPTPRLLGVAAGRFLISVDPHDPAEEAENGADASSMKTETLQLGPGTYLLMPAGVRHSAWVTGGAPVDLVVGARPE